MQFQLKFRVLSVLFPILMLSATSTHATTATWSISGNLGQISQELLPYFTLGDAITGSMIIEERAGCESTSGGVFIRASFCDHKNAITSLSVNVGTHSFISTNSNNNGRILIRNSTSSGDAFDIGLANPTSSTTDFASVGYSNISMRYKDSTGSALSSTALTLSPPDASLFDLTEFILTFTQATPIEGGGNQFQLTNSTASASNLRFNLISAVPEPESYAMLLAGLGLVGFVSRRRKVT